MSIRKKTMTIIVLTFLVLVASLTVAAKILVMGGFIKLEQQDARTNVQRGMNEIANSLSSLNSIAGDWAPWDDTYNFVQDRNEAYISNNLNAETLVNLRLNFMLFINTDRQIVHGVYVDLNEATESPRPPNLVDLITSTSKLAEHADLESSQAGILMMASQPVMVASRPIIKSDFSGPIRGALVVGRYLDATEIERLGGITHLTLSVQPFDDKKIPDEFKNAKSAFSDDTHTVIRLLDQAFIAGYGLLKDIDGKPALILKAKIPRNIYYHGRTTIIYYVASLFGIGMIFIALATILLEKVVLSRLSRLNHAVSDIGASGDLSRKLTVDSKDELGNLSTEINDMLAQLKDARQKLLGQSYRSGMSDMAAGVLHNVRNSLNPVVGHIELLRDNLKKAPINQIEMAQQELEKGGVSEERKKDLVKFLTLADKTLIKLVNDTRYKLDDTVERIMHIEQILDDHQKWAHTQAPQEEIQLYNLIQDALNFIRHDFGGDGLNSD